MYLCIRLLVSTRKVWQFNLKPDNCTNFNYKTRENNCLMRCASREMQGNFRCAADWMTDTAVDKGAQ